MPKRFEDCTQFEIYSGFNERRKLVGEVENTELVFDIAFGRHGYCKIKLQTRFEQFVLVRLDVNSQPHTNPNGDKIAGDHMHIYREGFGDKWACLINPREFPNPMDWYQTFHDFCNFCSIDSEYRPRFQRSLIR